MMSVTSYDIRTHEEKSSFTGVSHPSRELFPNAVQQIETKQTLKRVPYRIVAFTTVPQYMHFPKSWSISPTSIMCLGPAFQDINIPLPCRFEMLPSISVPSAA